ncbi:MAG: hypothetical protein GX146_04380 [Myxococcales bacterium]|jgi:tellurite resistance protein|nr:hypothetical protein [Myxococcales bacterium]
MQHEDRVKICSAVAQAILSDGQVTDDERAFIDNLMARWELTDAERKEVLRRNLDDDVEALVAGIEGFASRNALMVELVMAVAADGELSATERDLLMQVAQALGVEADDMDMLVKNALM